MRQILKTSLCQCGFNPKNYCVHGLRAGRVVDLLRYGVPIDMIKKLGRWSSNAVYKYLK